MTVINQSKYVYVVDGPEQGADGAWYKVDYDGDLGWVLGGFLSPARPRQAPPARREEAPAARPAPSAPAAAPARPASPPLAAPVDPPTRAASGGGPGSARRSPSARSRSSARVRLGRDQPADRLRLQRPDHLRDGQFGIYPGRTSDTQAGAGRA